MYTILVVEDESSLRENIQETLELNDYRILAAENGFSALKICETELPDLVISDIMMPGMDGYQMLDEFQKNPRTASIPFIFLTAKSGDSDIRKGMSGGADDYITKPFKVKDLLAAVAARLSKKEKVDNIVTQATSNISKYVPHELRTPLVSIMGFTQVLIEDTDNIKKEEMLEYLKKIKQASSKLHKTIEKFLLYSDLSFSKIQLDNQEDRHFNIVPGEISDFVKNCASAYSREEDMVIKIEPAAVNVAQGHFLIMLEEVVDNALKFSSAGTQIKVTGYTENEKYKIQVLDFGIGLSKTEIESIAPFVQHDRYTTGQEGSGLGLVVVQKLLKLYNGFFDIESQEKKFTRIILSFPS